MHSNIQSIIYTNPTLQQPYSLFYPMFSPRIHFATSSILHH